MAKMFYTMDETKAALAKNEEEIKQFAREGRLREFRDGPRLMFKADQVESLKAELGGGGPAADQIDLTGPGSESGAPIGLVDSRGASGSAIALADSSTGNVPISKDDTALAADLGGSMGGVPSPGRGGSSMGGKAATGTGVTVFGADEVDRADPGAQTAISPGMGDNINLDSVGSGSGLLDLTRESDDTSLGALALDQTGPGMASPGKPARKAAGPGETSASLADAAEESVVVRAPVGGQTVYRDAVDELAPAFAGAAAAACLVILLVGYVMMAALAGFKPTFLVSLASQGPLLLAAYGLGLAVVFFIIGLFLGKAVSR